MQMEILLTPHIWLQARPEVRNFLSKEFCMNRTGTPRCVTERGVTRVESDGFTINDLRKLNASSMQHWLGFVNIDPSADLNALFGMCVDRAESILSGGEFKNAPEPPEVDDSVKAPQVEEKPATAQFCAFCDSKGVRHKANCTRNK